MSKVSVGSSPLAKNVASQYLMQAAKYIFPFLTLPYLARVLGSEAYAIRSYVLSLMTFAQTFADYGFLNYGTKEITEARKQHKSINSVFSSVFYSKCFIIPFVFVGIVCISMLLPITRRNMLYVVIAFSAVGLNALLPDYLFQGYEKMETISFRFIVSKALGAILTFLIVNSPDDLLLVPLIDLITSAFALALSLRSAKMLFHIALDKFTFGPVLRAIKDSTQYFLSAACSTVLSSFSTLMVGFTRDGSVLISVWSMSLSVINAFQAMYTPVSNSLYPHMLMHADYRHLKRYMYITAPFALALSGLVALFSQQIITIFGGAEYSDGAYVLAIVAPVLFFSYFNIMIGWPVLGALKQVGQLSRSSFLAASFTIVSLGIAYVCGVLTIPLIAVIRSLTELLLALIRLFYCRKAISTEMGSAADEEGR